MQNLPISFKTLLTDTFNANHLPLEMVAKTYFNVSLRTFKKHLKEDPFLQQLGVNIKEGIITIDQLSAIFNNARDKSAGKLHTSHSTAQFDSGNIPIEKSIFIRGLVKQFSTPIIPYHKVAKAFLGWHSSRSAIAKYHDGTLEQLQLVTMCLTEGNNETIFVNVFDLENFLSMPKKVTLF
ncbi:hypothetical protein A9267_10855 [Shewanella sp. UCD-FRSSP16_17]|uniref:hypothetical protein n=1 Tax=Shewanella sp. UCD-FRSSP16_17 TaxID=1853256 RepID=UPI0007EEA8EF|nr:hypothetical protein [Shewanella sp. UCD-FRSSP16_17]OBT08210.1 hypothetical protein A9267_10855 [Shewanella sp. UCD-FRSSP16_17]